MKKCFYCKKYIADESGYDWYDDRNRDVKYSLCYNCHENKSFYDLEAAVAVLYEDSIKPTAGIKFDDSKLDWTYVMSSDFNPLMAQVVRVMELGAKKYSRDNWKHLDPERIEKAMLRHVIAHTADEYTDKESGQSHLAHIITNCLFLMWHESKEVSSFNPSSGVNVK